MKIFHTGDIHIGMKFNRYNEINEKLIDARFQCLENMINKSNELECDLFVIAGDLFNSLKITKNEIQRTIEIINKFNGNALLILPGNHDYDNGSNMLWNTLKKESGDKVIIINEKRPYSLKDYNLDVLIYPAPCNNKHSAVNALDWIKNHRLDEDDFEYKIGVAHGAIEGLSADTQGQYYYMTFNELNEIPVDIWLIGHTHISYPFEKEIYNNKIFNAGTPEADGLNFSDKACAWYIELNKDTNRAIKIPTGKYHFVDTEYTVKSNEDIEKMKNEILEHNPEIKIIRLKIKGNLSHDEYINIKHYYSEIEDKVLCLIVDDDDLKEKVDVEKISKEFTKGSFPYEFLMKLSDDSDTMQIAYDLIRGDE